MGRLHGASAVRDDHRHILVRASCLKFHYLNVVYIVEPSFLFLDVDPSKLMDLEARAKEHIKDLQCRIKAKILAKVGGKFSIAGLAGTIQSLFLAKASKQKLSRAESLFTESSASADRITNNVLSLLVGASIELSQCELIIFPMKR